MILANGDLGDPRRRPPHARGRGADQPVVRHDPQLSEHTREHGDGTVAFPGHSFDVSLTLLWSFLRLGDVGRCAGDGPLAAQALAVVAAAPGGGDGAGTRGLARAGEADRGPARPPPRPRPCEWEWEWERRYPTPFGWEWDERRAEQLPVRVR